MLMTCRHVAQVRDVYLDGELSPSLTAEVHAHLLQCPECQEQFEMFRACGEVIAKDPPEPRLDSGFASRVVASLPKANSTFGTGLQTRRSLRQRFWRLAIGTSVPAAAAVLFFAVLIWPSGGPYGQVLPAVYEKPADAVQGVVTPTLNAFEETQDAVKSLGKLRGILAADVQKNVGDARHYVDEGEGAENDGPEVTLLDVLLQPFRDVLQPIEEQDTESPDEEKIIRF
ncbi:MAG: zf-HC2 domain-containing protein [Phycisphaerales bacterium]|nr:zf-HC2 domain-containing protein [Phycisphaerales bacterium]